MSATCALRGIYTCHRLAHPSRTFSRTSTCQKSIRPNVRVFTTSPWRCKDDSRAKNVPSEIKVEAAEATKTPTVQQEKATGPAKQPTLLAEQTVSNKEQRKADWAIIKDMVRYLWPKDDFGTRFRVGLSVALLVGAKVLNVQVPFYFKSIVDSMNIDFAAVGGTAVTVAGATIFASIRRVAATVFDHLLKLDLNFHLSRQTGGLTRAIDRGTKGISFLLQSMVFHIIPTALEISLVCGILTWQYGFKFALITAATMVGYSAFTILTTSWRTKFRKAANAADNKGATVAVDSLINYETVKYFNNERYEVGRYDAALRNYQDASIKVATSLAFLNSGQNLIFSSALTAMMYYGADGVATGQLTVGDLKVNVAIKEPENAKPLMLTGGGIKFENVSFGYRPDRPILRNLNLEIPAGKKIAIVGPSGCGKSTILRLLFRSYDVQGGRILIDGQDIRDVQIESLRKAIGVVPQDTPLFNDTIEHNLRYGDLEAPPEKVEAAAKRAKVHDIIQKFPDKYATMVGERGMMISGGEKQRLAIARLLLKDPPFLFFDEATSALDTHTEQALLGNINSILKEKARTSIFVAHRLRTIYDSDIIIVLKDGDVAEQGTHERLVDSGGVYSELWSAQEMLFIDEEQEKSEEKKKQEKKRK
ncbi:unnamed protein product [Aureobasidium pullulans]|nr:unnamed protein product [Aureobasidium pullulans]